MIGYIGIMSSGKTLKAIHDIREIRTNERIITNIHLNLPNVETLSYREIIKKSMEDSMSFRNTILFLDEFHWVVDARRSSSLLNVNFTEWLTQIGKLDCQVYYTSQILNSQIDTRVRDFSTDIIHCYRFYYDTDGKLQYAHRKKRIIAEKIAIYYEHEELADGMVIRSRRGIYEPSDSDYSVFDTREIVVFDREEFKAK